MKNKILGVVAMAATFLIANPMTSHAFYDETPETEVVEIPEEPMGPLTPDGNLTLVDDYGSDKSGKQFITVVTKSGHYFYIVIDRDDTGSETVHFMNLVDEADILALLDEDELEQYKTEKIEVPVPIEKPVDEPIKEPEPEPKKSGSPALIVLLAGGIMAGGAFFYVKKKNKKQEPIEDPDADYDEDYEITNEEEEE